MKSLPSYKYVSELVHLQGNPRQECRRIECRTSRDCESDKSCSAGRCSNPCQLQNACGANAQCRVTNHQKRCSCPQNHVGNPNVECKPDRNECEAAPCGPNAHCRDLVGGYDCQCQAGCTGDPFRHQTITSLE